MAFAPLRPLPLLKVSGTRLESRDSTPVRLRGAGLGGWMNMKNLVTHQWHSGNPINEPADESVAAIRWIDPPNRTLCARIRRKPDPHQLLIVRDHHVNLRTSSDQSSWSGSFSWRSMPVVRNRLR